MTALLVLAALGLAVRLGSLARLALGRRHDRPRSRSRRPSAASRSSSWSWRPWWARQLAVFGSLSPSTASGKVLFIRDIDGVEQHHDAGHPGPPARHGHRPAARDADRRARRRADDLHHARRPAFVLAPFMVIGGWARRRSRRLRPVLHLRRRSCSPSRRSSRRSTCPGGTFIHSADRARAVQLHPGARGRRRRRRLGRRPATGLGRATAPRGSSPAPSSGSPSLCAVAGSLVVHAAWDGRRERGWPSRRPSTPPAPPPTDRVMSIDAASTQVLDGPRRRRPRQRPARHHPRGRARVRHPLARPGQGRLRAGRERRSWPVNRPSWDRPADRAPGIDRAARSTRWSPARDPARGGPVRRRRSSSWRCVVARLCSRRRSSFPKPEDTAYYFGVARNLRRGSRPRLGRDLELPDAAARLPAAGVRGLAAAAVVPRRDPDGVRRRDLRRVAVVGGRRSARSCRCSPGAWPRTSRPSAACRRAGPGRWPSARG